MTDILLYSQYVSSTSTNNGMEKALSNVLLPIIKTVYHGNGIQKVYLFITREEIKYLEEMHPEINMLIHSLVKKKALVLLTGTSHNINPIFFPQKTISSDIEIMTTELRRAFTRRPSIFFPYGSIWSPTMLVALENSGIRDVFFPPLKNINSFPKGVFRISNLQKSINVRHSDEKIDGYISEFLNDRVTSEKAIQNINSYLNANKSEEILIGIDIDSMDNPEKDVPFIEELLNLIKSNTQKFFENNEDILLSDEKNMKEDKKDYPLFFLPAGCYSDLYPNFNIHGEILSDDKNMNVSRMLYVINILLNNDTKKIISDRTYMNRMMCSLSSAALFFKKYNTEEYSRKRLRDFYDILVGISTTQLMKYDFQTNEKLYQIILSKMFFILENNGTLEELGLLQTGVNLLEGGYAFKDTFIHENGQETLYPKYQKQEFEKKTTNDIKEVSSLDGATIQKEIHVRSSAITVNTKIVNNGKKNFTYTYAPAFFFKGLNLDEKRDEVELTSVKYRVKDNKDTVQLTFSNSLLYTSTMNKIFDNDKSIFQPRWNLKLKKDEIFELSTTLRYDKVQEGKK